MQTEGWGKMQGLLFFGAFSTASLGVSRYGNGPNRNRSARVHCLFRFNWKGDLPYVVRRNQRDREVRKFSWAFIAVYAESVQ